MEVGRALDIKPEQRRQVVGLLARHLPGASVWAYGSRVQGTARPHSDLDLVVFVSPRQRLQVEDLREAFEESELPFRVDLHVWEELPGRFRKRIEDSYVCLV